MNHILLSPDAHKIQCHRHFTAIDTAHSTCMLSSDICNYIIRKMTFVPG